MSRAPETLAELARAQGPLAAGEFRSVVCEADARATFHDHRDLEDARGYADDAASERELGIVLAYVFDHTFALVYRGRHYAER